MLLRVRRATILAGLLCAGILAFCARVASGPVGAEWPNEPAGLPLRSDHAWVVADMTSAGSAGWRNAYPSDYPSLVTIASDATAPLGDTGNILEFIYPLGYDAGTSPGTIYYAFSPSLAEVYLAFWWKADSNWENGPGDTNKMAYIHNQGGSGQIWVAMSSSDHTTFVYSGQVQGINLYPNVNADVVSLGVWHRIELHVKLQQAGVASSTVEWWMDNRLQGRYTNINPLDRAINDVQFAPVWGGVGAIKQRGPNYFWFDHVRVSGH